MNEPAVVERPLPPSGSASAIALGLALAALGVFVAVEGGAVAGAQTYARVGPEVFPRAVGAGLALIGALLALEAWRRRWSVQWAAPASATGQWQHVLRLLGRVLLMASGLIFSAALMQPAGFIAATTTLFLCVTIAFGSRAPIRDLAIGLVFTASVFLIFTMGLGLSLPRGQLWSP